VEEETGEKAKLDSTPYSNHSSHDLVCWRPLQREVSLDAASCIVPEVPGASMKDFLELVAVETVVAVEFVVAVVAEVAAFAAAATAVAAAAEAVAAAVVAADVAEVAAVALLH